MKVVCESCQAKYQVPDERVAGKKLKIRCKRCGATLLIRGDQTESMAAPPEAATTIVATEPGEWHVSVEGQTYGPFATPELLSWLSAHPTGWEAFVWREGYSEWIEARASAELVHAAGGAPSVSSEAAAPTFLPADDDATRMYQGESSPSLPPASSVASRPGLHSRSASRPPSARSGSHAPRAASSPAPAAAVYGSESSPRLQAAAPQSTGERREDSVLFSTQNLQRVASSPSQPPRYGSGIRAGHAPGHARGDGSGVIDIRALASLARQTQASVAPGAVSTTAGHGYGLGEELDDPRASLLQSAGTFQRIDTLAPIATQHRSNGNAALPLAILGGFALVAAAAFAAIVITRPVAPAVASVEQAPLQVAAAAQNMAALVEEPLEQPLEQPVAATEAAEAEEAAPSEAVVEEAAEAQAEPAPELATADKRTGKRVRGRAVREDKKPAPDAKTKTKDKKPEQRAEPSVDDVMLAGKSSAPQPEEPVLAAAQPESAPAKSAPAESSDSDIDDLLGAKPPKKEPAKNRSIDDLLDGAVEKKAATSKPAENLPESPSRDDTLAAMRGVEAAVQACAQQEGVTGTAQVQIQVSGSTGRVTSANVDGVSGGAGSCIARAVRSAKFPRFSKDAFAVKFPYRLK